MTIEAVRKLRGSIIAQVTLLVAAILILSVLVTGGVALLAQRRWSTRSLEAKASSLVQFMAQVSPLGVLSLDFVQMRNNVRKVVLTDEEVVYALILNEQGTVLAHYAKETNPVKPPGGTDPSPAIDAQAARALSRPSGRVMEVTAPSWPATSRWDRRCWACRSTAWIGPSGPRSRSWPWCSRWSWP